MTEQERYLFDLQGYLVVPNALSAQQLEALNALMDAKVAEENVAEDATSHRFQPLIDWGGPYFDLIDNPRISPYFEELIGPKFRLDHEYGDIIRSGKGPVGTWLHGGMTPFDPTEYYVFNNGKMYNGLMVVAYNLRDVGPEDGGTACIPGSHKSNLPFPQEWCEMSNGIPSCVQRVYGPAGTAIVFTEAITHGTLPWRGSHERRTLFYKYSPHPLSWSSRRVNLEDYPHTTERQKAILEGPHARYKPPVKKK